MQLTLVNTIRSLRWFVPALFTLITACANDDSSSSSGNNLFGPHGSSSTGGTGTGNTAGNAIACPNTTAEAPLACCELANTMVDFCMRCGGSQSECVSAVNSSISTASNGQGCAGADQLADSSTFYDECLPALENLSCSATSAPSSCADQILYVQ
jgi:hypothetical protein